jgi:predicted phage terminase large subunit-like protein
MDRRHLILSSDPVRYQRQIEAELCRRSLGYFIRSAWPVLEPGRPLVWGWPLEALIEHLEAVHRGEITRFLATVPPGSMKSLTTRVFSPVWRWLNSPSSRFIGASYAHHLAIRDNRRAKALIESDWFRSRFPEVEIDPNRAASENFANRNTGWMMATSVEGVGTGERGDQFIIDDPLSVTQADSPVKRQSALKWFHETVPSRLNDLERDQIVLIMQRLHEEDVANAAIDLGYEHLNIPMHFDPDATKTTGIGWEDPRSTPGELMWPERFPEEAVASLENTLGPYAAAAQLEQTPVPRTGGLIETEQINEIDELPAHIARAMSEINPSVFFVRAWDLAGSEGKGAYTVGVLIAQDHTAPSSPIYIIDVRRKRINPSAARQLMVSCAADDPPGTRIIYPRDPGQAGMDQAQTIASVLEGYAHRPEAQSGSKETRAEPFAAKVGTGQIFVLQRAWTEHYVQELRFFPKGKYKDQVDASSSAYNELARMNRRRPPEIHIRSESQTNRAKVARYGR